MFGDILRELKRLLDIADSAHQTDDNMAIPRNLCHRLLGHGPFRIGRTAFLAASLFLTAHMPTAAASEISMKASSGTMPGPQAAGTALRRRILELLMPADINDWDSRQKGFNEFGMLDKPSQQAILSEMIEKCDQSDPDRLPLRDRSFNLAYDIARLVDRFGLVALAPVISALEDKRPAVRASAAIVFGNLMKPQDEAVTKLVPMLADSDPQVRRAAAGALHNMRHNYAMHKTKPPDDLYSLSLLKLSKMPAGRGTACKLMGRYGTVASKALAVLIECLNDTDPEIREGAAMALGALGDTAERAVPALGRLLDDKNQAARDAAHHALGKMGTRSAADVLSASAEKKSQRLRAAIAAATALLESRKPETKDGNSDDAVLRGILNAYSLAESTATVELRILVSRWRESRIKHGAGVPATAPIKDIDFLASRSTYQSDPDIRLFMDILAGEWCATLPEGGQLRIKFWPHRESLIGGAVTAWSRFGGNVDLGQAGYHVQHVVIPVERQVKPERIQLLAVRSDATWNEKWWVSLGESGPVLDTGQRAYQLAPSCAGSWRCVADWEATATPSVILSGTRYPAVIRGTPKALEAGRNHLPIVQVGDQIQFSMAFTNWEKNSHYFYELFPLVRKSSAWLAPLCSSLAASKREKVNPGETTETSLTFQAISEPPRGADDSIHIEVNAGTGNLQPPVIQWQFVSSNSYQTARGECLGFERGTRVGSYGSFVNADRVPPITGLAFRGPAESSPTGTIIISTFTEISIDAIDQFLSDVSESPVVFQGFAVDRAIAQVTDLESFSNPITLDLGDHELAIGSLDEAGNAEIIHSIPIRVSARPPFGKNSIEHLDFSDLRKRNNTAGGRRFVLQAPPVTLLMTW